MTRSASTGSSRTCSACPGPVVTIAIAPSSSSWRNAATAASTLSASPGFPSATVVWPVWSMRTRRDMRRCYARDPPRARTSSADLQPELGPDDPGDLAPVRPSLRLAHHVADDHAHRLRVAGPQLRDDVRIGVQRGLDERLELVAAADGAQALGLHDRRRVAALGHQPIEHPLCGGLGPHAAGCPTA